MKFRIARNVTKREYFEFNAADETAARAAVQMINTKIAVGQDYNVEMIDEDIEFVEEKDVNGDTFFDLTGWRE